MVTTVLNVLKKDCKLEPLGNLDGNIENIVAAATAFMAKCYGSTVQGSMSDIGYDIWLKKSSKRKVTAKLKLQTLPPTAAAFKENVSREHLQACILKSALSYDPITDMDPCKFGWSKDELTKFLVPISVPSDVPAASNDIHNPNTFTGVVGKVRKNLAKEEGRVEEKSACSLAPAARNPGLPCASVAIDKVRRLCNTTCGLFWR